jgi:hypothetical protein
MRETAQLTRMSLHTVRRLVLAGTLPSVVTADGIRVVRRDVLARYFFPASDPTDEAHKGSWPPA